MNLSSKTLNKAKIIYERLYKEYGGDWNNLDDFADKLGLTRGGLDYRRSENVVKYDDIKRVFPDINKDWLHSDDINELQSKPVKKNFTDDKFEKGFKGVEDRLNEEGMPYNALDLLLEALEEDASSIQNDLQSLVSRIRKLRKLRSDS